MNSDEFFIHAGGTYDALGGSINPRRYVGVEGTLDFGGSTASLDLANNCFGAFSKGQVLNATNATFTGGVGSIMEFASGFDPLGHDLGQISEHLRSSSWRHCLKLVRKRLP